MSRTSAHVEAPLDQHPVFGLLPLDAQRLMSGRAEALRIRKGGACPDASIFFIMRGTMGLFPNGGPVCVDVLQAGNVVGWNKFSKNNEQRALADCMGYAIDRSELTALLGSGLIAKRAL